MKTLSNIFMWIISGFMVISALVYMPSLTSVLLILVALIAAPIRPLRDFWASKQISGMFKAITILVLFIIAACIAPADRVNTDNADKVSKPPQATSTETEGTRQMPEEPSPVETLDSPSDPQNSPDTSEPPGYGTYTLPCGMELQFWDEVRNDVTGRWRRAATSDSFAPADYAVEYYNMMFHSDDELHSIWNATLKTTTSISVFGNLLFVDTYEYVKGEEHDAKIMFSGTKLDSRIIDKESGEPLEIEPEQQTNPEPEGSEPQNVSEPPTVPEETKPVAQPEPDPEQNSSLSPEAESGNSNGVGNGGNSNGVGNGDNFNAYDNEDQQKTTSTYVLNSGTMKFHYPSCSSVKKIAPKNYSTYDGTRENVIAKGYSPCGKCHP